MLCLWSPARAIDSDAGTGGAQFLKIGAGNPRAMALGRAYVAQAEGADALTWNPAGLGRTQRKEAVFGYTNWLQGFNGQYLAYAHPLGRTVWGANLAYFTLDDFDVRNEQGIPQVGTTVLVRDFFSTFAVARSLLTERLFLGGGLKWVHEDNSGPIQDSFVADLGALVRIRENLHAGFALQNFGAPKADVASTLRFGGVLNIRKTFNLSLEISQANDNETRVGIGGEFIVPEYLLQLGQIAFRAGFFSTDNLGQNLSSFLKTIQMDRTSGLSLGIGLFSNRAFGYGMGLDYAFAPMGALGLTHHLTVKMKF
ncbi:MAG: PorV/PorQ family protein [Elusimicrobia bacterium]|nr:PorV/PorQ family protein [Elusimicrobiota bacterium]